MGRCPLSPHKHTQMLMMYAQTYMCGKKNKPVIPVPRLQRRRVQMVSYTVYTKAKSCTHAIRGITTSVPAGG